VFFSYLSLKQGFNWAPHNLIFFFLCLIVGMCPKILSRLGHFTYDIVGGQIMQTAVHHSQANTVGTTEVSLASLAELLMLGVAIIANDVSHFGSLAALSMAAVIGAASLYYHWMARVADDGVAFDSASTVCRSKVEDIFEL
jgi:hypothetical protein